MDGLEKATDTTGAAGRGNACDCYGPWDTTVRYGHGESGDHDGILALAQTVEGEILPRLLLSERLETRRLLQTIDSVTDHDTTKVEMFTRLVMSNDVEDALAYVAAARSEGLSSEAVLMDLLGPTARRLGEMWLADECSFFDVTVGLVRLQQILQDLGRDIVPAFGRSAALRCLLAPAPDEQHTFGLLTVEEFFRRAGWETNMVLDGDAGAIIGAVARERYAMAGFSLSSGDFHGKLKDLIARVRKRSKNPDIVVMVGGYWFNEDLARVADVGADLCAVDGRQAIVQTRRVLRLADAHL